MMFDNFPECRQAAQIFDFETWNGKFYIIILKFVLIFNIFSNSSLIYGLVRTNQLRRFSNRLFFALSVNGLVAGSLAMVSLSTSIFVQTEGGCRWFLVILVVWESFYRKTCFYWLCFVTYLLLNEKMLHKFAKKCL